MHTLDIVERTIVSGEELWQWRERAIASAKTANIAPAEVDWLLQELSVLDRLLLHLQQYRTWPQVELSVSLNELSRLWHSRTQELVPVQYLARRAPWRDFFLTVSPTVLIPRPETEMLVDLAATLTSLSAPRGGYGDSLRDGHWVDLGTGSGAIACGLAKIFPEASIYAVDVSTEALAIAQANAQRLGLSSRIQFSQGSWLEPLTPLQGNISGLVANPPYIPTAMINELQPEVAWHEPHLALDGGEDGLSCIRHLITAAPNYLRPGGLWLVEMMAGQASGVFQLLQAQGCYKDIQIHPDLSGIDRFASARLKLSERY